MLPLNFRETHYTKKLEKIINQEHPFGIKHVFRVEGLTTCNGVSDLLGWTKDGKFVAIEVKADITGKLSAQQSKFLKSVKLGYVAFVGKTDTGLLQATMVPVDDNNSTGAIIQLGRERC